MRRLQFAKVFLAISMIALVIGCDEDPEPRRPFLRLEVRDPAGNPMEGMTVAAYPQITDPRDFFECSAGAPTKVARRASTRIEVCVEQPSNVTIVIADIDDRVVRHLFEDALAADTYQFAWDGHDDADMPMVTGVYRFHVVARSDAGEMLFESESEGLMYLIDADVDPIGITDNNGVVETNDKSRFPFDVSVPGTDENGDTLGDIRITRSIFVILKDETTSETLTICDAATLADDDNVVTVTWNPPAVPKTSESRPQDTPTTLPAPLRGDTWRVAIYPNPFN